MQTIKNVLSGGNNPQRPTSKPPTALITGDGDPNCPKCRGIGYWSSHPPPGAPGFGQANRCDCTKRQRADNLQELSGLSGPELQRRMQDIDTLASPGMKVAVDELDAFLDHPVGILTLWGPPGVGKTLALHAMTNELSAGGIQALYIAAFDVLGHLQASFDEPPSGKKEGAYKRLLKFERTRVLLLDEFDKRPDSSWARLQFTDLIDKRHRFGEAGEIGTIIASNTDPRLEPDWIASRLTAKINRVVHIDGADMRPLVER